MHFSISRLEFIDLLVRAHGIIGQKPVMAILSNVVIEANNDELILTTSDLTTHMRCFTSAKILKEGAITVPAKRLLQLVRELTSVNIEFKLIEENVIEIIADSASFRLNGRSYEEYPEIPSPSHATHVMVPQQAFKQALEATAFAVSREDVNYVLCGIQMRLTPEGATLFGTDGKRLSKTVIPMQVPSELVGDYVIPIRAIEEIINNLTDDEGSATLYPSVNLFAIETEQMIFTTKLLEGEYPDCDALFPAPPPHQIHLHREEFITLLRQISLFTASRRSPALFHFSEGEVVISAHSPEIGEGKVSMPVNYHETPLEIALSPHYFLDIMRNCRGESVICSCTDRFTPILITESPDTAQELPYNTTYILMSMSMGGE